MIIKKGANIPLGDVNSVTIGVSWSSTDTALDDDIMLAAVLCNEHGKALSAADVVFLNQIQDSVASVVMDDDKEQIDIDLSKVPPHVDKIDVVLWINSLKRSLNQLRTCSTRVLVTETGLTQAETGDMVPSFGSESATCLVSVYRYKGAWKVRHVSQGWENGLQGLLSSYGVS